jgi:hypothetical protein
MERKQFVRCMQVKMVLAISFEESVEKEKNVFGRE